MPFSPLAFDGDLSLRYFEPPTPGPSSSASPFKLTLSPLRRRRPPTRSHGMPLAGDENEAVAGDTSLSMICDTTLGTLSRAAEGLPSPVKRTTRGATRSSEAKPVAFTRASRSPLKGLGANDVRQVVRTSRIKGKEKAAATSNTWSCVDAQELERLAMEEERRQAEEEEEEEEREALEEEQARRRRETVARKEAQMAAMPAFPTPIDDEGAQGFDHAGSAPSPLVDEEPMPCSRSKQKLRSPRKTEAHVAQTKRTAEHQHMTSQLLPDEAAVRVAMAPTATTEPAKALGAASGPASPAVEATQDKGMPASAPSLREAATNSAPSILPSIAGVHQVAASSVSASAAVAVKTAALKGKTDKKQVAAAASRVARGKVVAKPSDPVHPGSAAVSTIMTSGKPKPASVRASVAKAIVKAPAPTVKSAGKAAPAPVSKVTPAPPQTGIDQDASKAAKAAKAPVQPRAGVRGVSKLDVVPPKRDNSSRAFKGTQSKPTSTGTKASSTSAKEASPRMVLVVQEQVTRLSTKAEAVVVTEEQILSRPTSPAPSDEGGLEWKREQAPQVADSGMETSEVSAVEPLPSQEGALSSAFAAVGQVKGDQEEEGGSSRNLLVSEGRDEKEHDEEAPHLNDHLAEAAEPEPLETEECFDDVMTDEPRHSAQNISRSPGDRASGTAADQSAPFDVALEHEQDAVYPAAIPDLAEEHEEQCHDGEEYEGQSHEEGASLQESSLDGLSVPPHDLPILEIAGVPRLLHGLGGVGGLNALGGGAGRKGLTLPSAPRLANRPVKPRRSAEGFRERKEAEARERERAKRMAEAKERTAGALLRGTQRGAVGAGTMMASKEKTDKDERIVKANPVPAWLRARKEELEREVAKRGTGGEEGAKDGRKRTRGEERKEERPTERKTRKTAASTAAKPAAVRAQKTSGSRR